MCRYTVLVVSFLFYEHTVLSARVDQRQTGDLNVQIDLKNLQIVGLMKGKEEYVDYDYAYDYSEMTIKPPNGTTTTKKPLNVTETVAMSDKENTTTVTTAFIELEHTTSSIETKSSTEPGSIVTQMTTTLRTESNESNTEVNNPVSKPLLQDSTGHNNSTGLNCKKGFYRNSQGECKLKLQNPSNALLKMIKQKAKLNNGPRQP